MYEILLFYTYVAIDNPERVAQEQRDLCERLGLKGRLIVAREGLNITLEGRREHTEEYIRELGKDPRFADIHIKRSPGTGSAFPKLSIKVRPELVSLHLGDQDFSPKTITGTYISAEEMHDWIQKKKEFYIIDMRNDYEHAVGHFAGSVLPPMKNFRDLPQVLPQLEHLKHKTVVTVCTGGVRCEKASGFLLRHGFSDVYQLFGGIVTYMEKYPNEDFLGVLYVFDGRLTMGFNINDARHTIVGTCVECLRPSERYIDCAYRHCREKRHVIMCSSCCDEQGRGFCSAACREKMIVGVR